MDTKSGSIPEYLDTLFVPFLCLDTINHAVSRLPKLDYHIYDHIYIF